MKKGIIAAAVFIILAGGGYLYYSRNATPKPITEAPPGEKKGLTVLENNTLEGWLKKGKAVECKINSPEGEFTVNAKGENIRIEGMMTAGENNEQIDRNGVVLTTADWVYFWTGNKGTKFNNKTIKEKATPEQKKEYEEYDWESMVSNWEKDNVNYDCEEKRLSDDLFTEPKDVTFTDITNLFSGIPEVGNKFEGMTQEQINAELDKMNKQMPTQ